MPSSSAARRRSTSEPKRCIYRFHRSLVMPMSRLIHEFWSGNRRSENGSMQPGTRGETNSRGSIGRPDVTAKTARASTCSFQKSSPLVAGAVMRGSPVIIEAWRDVRVDSNPRCTIAT